MLKVKKIPHSSNQFSVLSDSAIVAWASMMGVQIPDDNFDYIDVLRELEISRNLLRYKRLNLILLLLVSMMGWVMIFLYF